ncbi:hypothetical protein BC828DRAFT_378355 [Blastocladiella britannica]|nr:hypothetical protein BC828DRAFT_378355 [Blastocladiella britannica]
MTSSLYSTSNPQHSFAAVLSVLDLEGIDWLDASPIDLSLTPLVTTTTTTTTTTTATATRSSPVESASSASFSASSSPSFVLASPEPSFAEVPQPPPATQEPRRKSLSHRLLSAVAAPCVKLVRDHTFFASAASSSGASSAISYSIASPTPSSQLWPPNHSPLTVLLNEPEPPVTPSPPAASVPSVAAPFAQPPAALDLLLQPFDPIPRPPTPPLKNPGSTYKTTFTTMPADLSLDLSNLPRLFGSSLSASSPAASAAAPVNASSDSESSPDGSAPRKRRSSKVQFSKYVKVSYTFAPEDYDRNPVDPPPMTAKDYYEYQVIAFEMHQAIKFELTMRQLGLWDASTPNVAEVPVVPTIPVVASTMERRKEVKATFTKGTKVVIARPRGSSLQYSYLEDGESSGDDAAARAASAYASGTPAAARGASSSEDEGDATEAEDFGSPLGARAAIAV